MKNRSGTFSCYRFLFSSRLSRDKKETNTAPLTREQKMGKNRGARKPGSEYSEGLGFGVPVGVAVIPSAFFFHALLLLPHPCFVLFSALFSFPSHPHFRPIAFISFCFASAWLRMAQEDATRRHTAVPQFSDPGGILTKETGEFSICFQEICVR